MDLCVELLLQLDLVAAEVVYNAGVLLGLGAVRVLLRLIKKELSLREGLLVLHQRQLRHIYRHQTHHLLVRVEIKHILVLQHLIVQVFLVDSSDDFLLELISLVGENDNCRVIKNEWQLPSTPFSIKSCSFSRRAQHTPPINYNINLYKFKCNEKQCLL